MAAVAARPIREKDLQRWRLLERFQTELAAEVAERGGLAGTWADPDRQLQLEQYLSLFLFGLFNPVVETMRGLCEDPFPVIRSVNSVLTSVPSV